MDPVRIPSGPSRAPIFAFLGTAFGQSGSSRDPVGIQAGSSRDPVGHQCREAAKFIKNSIFAVFLHVFGWFWLLPDRSKRGAKNSKIGARLDPAWPKAVPKNAKIGARLGPDWVPTGSRPCFFKKTPISLNLSTYFWNFSTLPCTTPPPPFPPPDPPPPVLSQTRAWQGLGVQFARELCVLTKLFWDTEELWRRAKLCSTKILSRGFSCVKCKCICVSSFCVLTGRAFWRAEQLRWAENKFEEMRKVDQCADGMKTVEKNFLR